MACCYSAASGFEKVPQPLLHPHYMNTKTTFISLVALTVPAFGQQSITFDPISHSSSDGQEIRRSFGSQFDGGKPFELSFDVNFQIKDNGSGQASGFRFYNESTQNSTFTAIWKTDVNNGALTFKSSGGDFVVSDALFNITDFAKSGREGAFRFNILVESAPGQNPGQFRSGFYAAKVTELSTGRSADTGKLRWTTSQNLPQNQFDEFVSFNSSNQTFVKYASTPVPEPSSALLAVFGMAGAMMRRRR